MLQNRKHLLGRLILVTIPPTLHHLTDQLRVYPLTNNGFHHSEVLEIVVSLEKSIARKELDKDAANTPNITWEAPAKIENDLGGSSKVAEPKSMRRISLSSKTRL
jgi:hypothetical protein